MNVKILNKTIRNSLLSSNAFAVYVILTYLANLYVPKVHYSILLEYLPYITETRYLKKYLGELYDFGLIEKKAISFRKEPHIYVKPFTISDNYTQLSFDKIINHLPVIKSQGLRLLYYYESYINRKLGREYAYPTFDLIISQTGLANDTIIKYNSILMEMGFIHIKTESNNNKYYVIL